MARRMRCAGVLVALACGLALATSAEAQRPAERAKARRQAQDANSLNAEAMRLYDAGKYVEATPVAERALAIREKALGPQHVDVAQSLHTLWLLYWAQDRYAEAEPLGRRGLAIREKVLGPRHADVGESLNALGLLYWSQGRYAEAEPLHRRGLAIRQKTLGPSHPDVGQSFNNLALVRSALGDFREAESLHERGLSIRERALGPNHPDVAQSLTNLAVLYGTQGSYVKAEPLHRRSLAIHEKAQGADHPRVGMALNNLAELSRKQGRFSDAEPLFRRSLAIHEKALGPNSADVGLVLNNLASLSREQGRYAEAESHYRRSLDVRERTFGPDHPNVALVLNNLAGLYEDQSRYGDAEPLYKRSLAIREKTSGPDSAEVALVLNNLGLLNEKQGRYADAEPLYRRSLAIRDKTVGPDHISSATVYNNLAGLYWHQSRFAEAEPLFRKSLVIVEKVLGADHPNVATALNNLAFVYRARGRFAEAEALYTQALSIFEKAFGPYHPSVGAVLSNLAWTALPQENWHRAARFWRRSTSIDERRSERGLLGTQGKSAIGEESRERFSGLIKAIYRAAGDDSTARADRAPDTFVAAQWAQTSEAAASLAQMAARSAKGSSELAALVRERQDVVAKWLDTDKQVIAAKSESPDRRSAAAERELDARLGTFEKRLAEIDTRFAQDFPDYAALVSPRPSSIADVQADLGDDEALVLLLDTGDFKPLPGETFVWVVTKTDMRWLRSEIGTSALKREVAALRCGLDATAWYGEGAPRCAELLKLPLEKAPKEAEQLPFDIARAHALYKGLFGEASDLIKGKHLLVVPSGALTTLPFQVLVTALPDGVTAGEVSREVGRLGAELGPLSDEGRKSLPTGLSAGVRVVRAMAGGPAELAGLKSDDILLAVGQRHFTTVPEAVAAVQAAGPGSAVSLRILRDGRRIDVAVTLGSLTVKVWNPLFHDTSNATSVRWLARDHSITVLPSVAALRSLRRVGRPSAAAKAMIGFANPLLDGRQSDPDNGTFFKELAGKAREQIGCAAQTALRTASLRRVTRSAAPVPTSGGLADPAFIRQQTPLPETADEVCAVARSVGADVGAMYIGATATETEVKRLSQQGELARYRIVHFATHGLLAGQLDGAQEPGLILTPPVTASAVDDGYLSASEIGALKLDADWVILSACNTAGGAGQGEAAEALSGLARVFFYAGARALLVSHWEVDSDAAVKLITAAIVELSKTPSIGRAEALRRAMLTVMADTSRPANWVPASHPAIWAPFVVVGEGGAGR